tara:strand:- start:8454 stop:8681 length:228 start_codon:yes stop_codon:yes gene_type:complete
MPAYQPDKNPKSHAKNHLKKKPDNKELRIYAKCIDDKTHPFNKVPKEKKLDIETIFIKGGKTKCPKGKKKCNCPK